MLKLINNDKTDKNSTHSYIELYENLLHNKQFTAKNILEIGIQRGGSIKLWHDYFINATVYALDIQSIDKIWDELKDNNRIILHTSVDAYDKNFVKTEFIKKILNLT